MAGAVDSPAIAVGGTAFVIAAFIAREVWRWREYGALSKAVTAAAAAS